MNGRRSRRPPLRRLAVSRKLRSHLREPRRSSSVRSSRIALSTRLFWSRNSCNSPRRSDSASRLGTRPQDSARTRRRPGPRHPPATAQRGDVSAGQRVDPLVAGPPAPSRHGGYPSPGARGPVPPNPTTTRPPGSPGGRVSTTRLSAGGSSPSAAAAAHPRPAAGPRAPPARRPARGTSRLLRLHVHPQAELARGLGGLRADAGDDRAGVRLARDADEVAHRRRRGEAHRVEPAGLDRLADRRRAAGRRAPCGTRSRRRSPSPARAGPRPASRWRCRRAAAAPGRPGRARRRTAGRSPAGLRTTTPGSGRRDQLGHDAERAHRVAGRASTQAILTPENARASSPNSANFSHTARTAFVEVNTTHW